MYVLDLVYYTTAAVCLQYWHCFSKNLGVNAVRNANGGEAS